MRALRFLFASLLLAPSAAHAAKLTIDPLRTRIGFAIDAVGYPQTHGVFHKFDGMIEVDFDRPERSRVVFRVETDSVDVGSTGFSDYVKSQGWLDAAHHPSIDFVSREVRKLDEHTVRVTGDMTLLGVTRPLVLDVAVQRNATGGCLGFATHTSINRLEFGMNAGFPIVARDVGLDISTEAAAP